MEIHHQHHHDHPQHKEKLWKHYALEFFMLFLAVYCGFLAENFREQQTDRSKERVYLSSLVEELAYDTSRYNKVLETINVLSPYLDSLYKNVKELGKLNYVLQGKWNMAVNVLGVPYKPDMPTIQEMKSSGNLRLIENTSVRKKIVEYETMVENSVERVGSNVNAVARKVYDYEDALCDYSNFVTADVGVSEDKKNDPVFYSLYNMTLMTKDTLRLNEFANSFVNYKEVNKAYNKIITQAKESSTELIKSIKDEYHLE